MDEYHVPFLEDDEEDDDQWWEDFEDFFTEFLLSVDDGWREKHQDIVDGLHAELTGPTSRLAKSRAVGSTSTDIEIC